MIYIEIVYKFGTTSKSSYMSNVQHICIFWAQSGLDVYQIPEANSPPESSATQCNFHCGRILFITVLKTAYWNRFSGRHNRGFVIMAEKYIYSDCLLGPHSPVQSGFHISQEEIGWNSQHHSELVNETKSHNLKYQFIHLTNEAVYWWLIAVLCWWMTHYHSCTSKNTLCTGTWPEPHTRHFKSVWLKPWDLKTYTRPYRTCCITFTTITTSNRKHLIQTETQTIFLFSLH